MTASIAHEQPIDNNNVQNKVTNSKCCLRNQNGVGVGLGCMVLRSSASGNYLLLPGLAFGLIVSFGLFALVLESITSSNKVINEFCVLLICCSFYTLIAFIGKKCFNEPNSKAPFFVYVLLSITTFCSSYTGIRALRHVSYPVKILGKTCKPIPIMLIGLAFGKTYSFRKYISVFFIISGASMFLMAQPRHSGAARDSVKGVLLLVLSLCFDGATGALEDKFIKQYHIAPLTMMLNINKVSICIALLSVLLSGSFSQFQNIIYPNPYLFVCLGISGGMGQVFIFMMISNFGALVTSVVGTARKMITISASILFFGHMLQGYQIGGLLITFTGLFINLIRKNSTPMVPRDCDVALTKEQNTSLLGKGKVYEDIDITQDCNYEMKLMASTLERLRRMNVDQNSDCNKMEFQDVQDILYHDGDNESFGLSIDATFRATTAL